MDKAKRKYVMPASPNRAYLASLSLTPKFPFWELYISSNRYSKLISGEGKESIKYTEVYYSIWWYNESDHNKNI